MCLMHNLVPTTDISGTTKKYMIVPEIRSFFQKYFKNFLENRKEFMHLKVTDRAGIFGLNASKLIKQTLT